MAEENEEVKEAKEAKGLKKITSEEIWDFAKDMKDSVLSLIDEQAKEVLTMGVRRGSTAVRGGVGSFISGLAGEESVCKFQIVENGRR